MLQIHKCNVTVQSDYQHYLWDVWDKNNHNMSSLINLLLYWLNLHDITQLFSHDLLYTKIGLNYNIKYIFIFTVSLFMVWCLKKYIQCEYHLWMFFYVDVLVINWISTCPLASIHHHQINIKLKWTQIICWLELQGIKDKTQTTTLGYVPV